MKKRNTLILILALVFIMGLLFILGYISQEIYPGEVVYLPEYSSTWCAPCDVGEQDLITETITPSIFQNVYKDYTCKGGYIPKGCKFEIEVRAQIGETGVYVCKSSVEKSKILTELNEEIGIGDGDDITDCTKYGDENFIKDLTKRIIVAQNQKLYLATEQDVSIDAVYTPYCLRTLAYGQLSSYSSCSRSNLIKNTKDIPAGVPENIPFAEEGAIENVVIGYTGYIDNIDIVLHPITKQIVFLRKGINNIEACPINTANDNRKYVDLNKCRVDNNFKCIPSQPATGTICEGGTKITTTTEGGSCEGKGFLGYRVIGEEKCEVSCVNGKIKIGDCKKIIGYEKGKVTEEEKTEFDWENYLPWIIGGVIALALFIIIIALIVSPKSRPLPYKPTIPK